MIVSFAVSNFRSFSKEETLSLVASNRLSGNHENHTVPIPDSKEQALRAAVVYGANGAGKSNLFKALKYLRSVALSARPKNSGTGRERFLFSGPSSEASSFDLQFIAASKLYRFGFTVDDERVVEEWLYQVLGNRQRTLYERSTDPQGRVSVDAPGLRDGGEKVVALTKVGGPQGQSFLATTLATLNSGDIPEELGHILGWFARSLTLVSPDEVLGPLAHALEQDPDFRLFASGFLKSISTGVDHLEASKREVSSDELEKLLPAHLLPFLVRPAYLEDSPNAEIVRLADGKEILIDHRSGRAYQVNIQAAHEQEPGKTTRLELTEESDGTRRLLNLIPALHPTAYTGSVFVIDEIDRSLHPILVRGFLEFFLNSSSGGLRQVIVTTHESSLLDQDLLRRDEIWFAEKDATGATRLYSLVDFKVRNDLEIRKHYLQGRFGAIPFLGDLENLAGSDRHD